MHQQVYAKLAKLDMFELQEEIVFTVMTNARFNVKMAKIYSLL